MTRDNGVILHGPRHRKEVALTFDADMTPYMRRERISSYDPAIVDALRETETRATVFVSGLWAEAYPDVLRSLADDPLFELANHTFSHAAFSGPCNGLPIAESSARKRSEVTDATAVIQSIAGVRTRYFRFPGDCYEASDVELVHSLGHRAVQWDVVGGDAFEADGSRVADSVLAGARPGSIVVLHLNGAPNAPTTARALRSVIPGLRERGLHAVTVSELLAP